MAEKTWGNYIFPASRVANSIVSVGIRSKFKQIQAFMHVLVTYKNEEVQIKKIKLLEWQQHFSHY